MIMTALLDTPERIQSRPIVFQSVTRPPQRPSDQAERLALLMRDAQEGDRTAYSSLLKEILPILKRLVQRRLGFLPIMDREDIVQEILLSLHAARATYDPKRPFMPWVMSIARNRMIDNARRNARRLNNEVLVDEFPAHLADDNAGEPASECINAKTLQHAISALPRTHKVPRNVAEGGLCPDRHEHRGAQSVGPPGDQDVAWIARRVAHFLCVL